MVSDRVLCNYFAGHGDYGLGRALDQGRTVWPHDDTLRSLPTVRNVSSTNNHAAKPKPDDILLCLRAVSESIDRKQAAHSGDQNRFLGAWPQ